MIRGISVGHLSDEDLEKLAEEQRGSMERLRSVVEERRIAAVEALKSERDGLKASRLGVVCQERDSCMLLLPCHHVNMYVRCVCEFRLASDALAGAANVLSVSVSVPCAGKVLRSELGCSLESTNRQRLRTVHTANCTYEYISVFECSIVYSVLSSSSDGFFTSP